MQNNDIEDLANSFTQLEINSIRKNLLMWYDKHHRVMPWRESPNKQNKETDKQLRAYQVWVSETMYIFFKYYLNYIGYNKHVLKL